MSYLMSLPNHTQSLELWCCELALTVDDLLGPLFIECCICDGFFKIRKPVCCLSSPYVS